MVESVVFESWEHMCNGNNYKSKYGMERKKKKERNLKKAQSKREREREIN